jgi:hypothetical protein
MKTPNFIFALLCFIGLNSFGQANSVSGLITEVKPHFAESYSMNVGKTEVILMVNPTSKAFEINKEYKDLLIEKDGKCILNPKYAKKQFTVDYSVNGKGWKCIQSVKPHHK